MKELIHLFLKLKVIILILEIIKIFKIVFENAVYVYLGTTKPNYGTNVIYSWSTPGQIESGSSSWHGPENTKPYTGSPISNTRFPTTKAPFNYGSTSDSTLSGSPYVGTGPKQPNFNIASSSAIANVGTSAFATSFNTYNSPGIIRTTPSYGTTLPHGRGTNYLGIKDFPGNIKPTYGTTYDTNPNGNAWSDKRPDIGSGTSSSRYPENVGGTWPIKQPGISNEPRGKPEVGSGITSSKYPENYDGNAWPNKRPDIGSSLNRYPENVGSTWPTKQPGISNEPRGKPEVGSSITSSKYPENYDGIWPTGRPGSTSGTTPRYFGIENGNRPTEKSTGGSGTWPDEQFKHGIGSGCSSVTCRSSTDSVGGSSNCKEGNYESTGPCTGSSGVKIYYPAGSGDDNIPNFGIPYKPNSFPNIGTGTYPGTRCGNGNSCNQGI